LATKGGHIDRKKGFNGSFVHYRDVSLLLSGRL